MTFEGKGEDVNLTELRIWLVFDFIDSEGIWTKLDPFGIWGRMTAQETPLSVSYKMLIFFCFLDVYISQN